MAVHGKRRRGSLLAMLIVGLLPLGGCTTALKQGYFEMRGAQGELLPMADVPLTDGRAFGEVEFAPATTTVSDRIIPRELLTAYDQRAPLFAENVRAEYESGAAKLTVQAELIYFQSKGMLSPAMLLARVRFLAGERLVQDSIVNVESKAFRAGNEGALVSALLAAIQGHCNEFFTPRPAEERKRRQEELKKSRAKRETKDGSGGE